MERKKRSETEEEREKEKDREGQNSSLPEFNIVYRAGKDEARAREKRVPAHATVDVEARAVAAMACMYLRVYIRMYTGRTKSPDYPYSNASARARARERVR